jgi:hypothetical protein
MNNLPTAFDHIFYSNNYNDLNNAFGYDKQLLENHYMTYGRFENRQYCHLPANFNWKQYVNNNPEIFNAIDTIYKDNVINTYIESISDNEKIKPQPKIIIVYYAFLNNDKDWRSMISSQIKDVYKSGIFSISKFHAVLSGNPTDIEDAKKMLEELLNFEIEITEVYENKYEFPAIIKMRELALEHPDKIFIYFHSKGMVNNNASKYRTQIEQKLTKYTFLNWESILYVFEKYPNIQKAALLPSSTGFGWYNFWWARASYLITCNPIEMPLNLVDNDRFICEVWLGEYGSNTWEDCYSIINKNISFSEHPSDEIFTKF